MVRNNIILCLFRLCVATLFTVLYLSSSAQPTLTSSANLPSEGQSFSVYTESQLGNNFDPGVSGANVNWDFSTLSNQSSASKSYLANNNSNYPDADLVSSFSGSQTFIGTGNNSYTYFGITSNAALVKYTDGQNQVVFPLTYQDTYSDTFSGSLSSFGQTFDREGIIEAEADGYGTLTTPEGTFSNVLRILIIRESQDYLNGSLVSNNLDSLYFWYNAHTAHPLMTCGKNYVDGSFSGSFANYISATDIVTGRSDLITKVGFKVYPNPVDDRLVIKGQDKYQVEVFNVMGKLQTTFSAKDDCSISVSNWESGPFIIVIQKNGQRMVQKVIVE